MYTLSGNSGIVQPWFRLSNNARIQALLTEYGSKTETENDNSKDAFDLVSKANRISTLSNVVPSLQDSI